MEIQQRNEIIISHVTKKGWLVKRLEDVVHDYFNDVDYAQFFFPKNSSEDYIADELHNHERDYVFIPKNANSREDVIQSKHITSCYKKWCITCGEVSKIRIEKATKEDKLEVAIRKMNERLDRLEAETKYRDTGLRDKMVELDSKLSDRLDNMGKYMSTMFDRVMGKLS